MMAPSNSGRNFLYYSMFGVFDQLKTEMPAETNPFAKTILIMEESKDGNSSDQEKDGQPEVVDKNSLETL